MTTRRDANTATPRLRTSEDWIVSHNKGFRANIIVWGMPKDLPTLEIRAKLADLGLDSFVRGAAFWEGEHVRLVLTPDDSKRLTKELVGQVSASLRKIGCRCVLDDVKSGVIVKSRPIECFNRYEPLTQLDYSNETVSSSLNSDVQNDRVNVDVDLVGRKAKAMVRNKRERKLRLATWNFSGLCSDRKQKEIGELLAKHNLDVVAGQESWEKEETRIDVEGYKWFGKPRIKQNSPRGDGGVGFLVRECLVNEVEFINTVKYEESVWMKIRSERGREALYIGCVYMPTDSTSISVMDSCYERLKEDVLSFREKGKVVLLGDFNARVGRSAQLDDVVGMFGENTCNASGNRLLSFLNEVELMICNGRKLVTEPEWTRIRPSLKQKSIIDYIITDAQLLEVSGNVHVDGTDIGSSDHLLVWMELGRASKTSKKRKRVIRRWRLDRFGDDEVKLSYQSALMAEVHEFSESTKSKIERGMKGQELVNEVVMEWESVVNRVAKCELGEKMIVCGRAARWWDEQIKDKINARRQLYKKVVNGREDLWGEYCRLRKEVKQLVIEKKLNIWNELVEKVNTDFDENKKEFWAFVG